MCNGKIDDKRTISDHIAVCQNRKVPSLCETEGCKFHGQLRHVIAHEVTCKTKQFSEVVPTLIDLSPRKRPDTIEDLLLQANPSKKVNIDMISSFYTTTVQQPKYIKSTPFTDIRDTWKNQNYRQSNVQQR